VKHEGGDEGRKPLKNKKGNKGLVKIPFLLPFLAGIRGKLKFKVGGMRSSMMSSMILAAKKENETRDFWGRGGNLLGKKRKKKGKKKVRFQGVMISISPPETLRGGGDGGWW